MFSFSLIRSKIPLNFGQIELLLLLMINTKVLILIEYSISIPVKKSNEKSNEYLFDSIE